MVVIMLVKELREADYVVNNVSMMKRDISSQGDKAEFSRVKAYLQSKWQYWFLKLYLMLSTSIGSLEMNLVIMNRNLTL